MNIFSTGALINFLGFSLGIALYAILLAMVIRHPSAERLDESSSAFQKLNPLILLTAILGLLWNIISLLQFALDDILHHPFSPVASAAAFSALGFLPAVVVNSEWTNSETGNNENSRKLTFRAYCMSGIAALMHFYNAIFLDTPFSVSALGILTAGYLLILAALFFRTRSTSVERKTVWTAAFALFAISAVHLSGSQHETEDSWYAELIGHQASLPFVFVILYQNFRFAFADLFLKRALSLVLLAAVVFGSYVLLVAPLSAFSPTGLQPDTQRVGLMLILWMLTALIYPVLHKIAVWFVDKIILRRADYVDFRVRVGRELTKWESVTALLKKITATTAAVLTAKNFAFETAFENLDSENENSVEIGKNETKILILTGEEPRYKIVLSNFSGGRRLLSEEIEMLKDVALQTARRIDVLRISHERCERELREQEFSSLAVEAELRALRAQINPHFLFNALTTIGYLINSAPERALQTLMQLTGLLRGVLRSTGEFQTLGEELKLISSYLEIEKARFEERLTVEIDVSDELLAFRIPSLILQPIVENAVKHGISPKKEGGFIKISATLENENFTLSVSDTGVGIDGDRLRTARLKRVGLNNIEQRLNLYFDGSAQLLIDSRNGYGTMVKIKIDVNQLQARQIKISTPIGVEQADRVHI